MRALRKRTPKNRDHPPRSFTTRTSSAHFQKSSHHEQNCPSQKVSYTLQFGKGQKELDKIFMALPTMGNIFIGMVFLKKDWRTLDFSENLVHFPDFQLQLKRSNRKYKYKMCNSRAAQKLLVPLLQQIKVLMCTVEDMNTSQGTVETNPSVNRKAALLVTPATVKLENNNTLIQVSNPSDHTYTISQGAALVNFTALTPSHVKNLKPMPLEQLSPTSHFPEEAPQVIDKLFQEPTHSEDRR